jgi:hypothetical protein
MSRNVGREHGQSVFVVAAVRAGLLEFAAFLDVGTLSSTERNKRFE